MRYVKTIYYDYENSELTHGGTVATVTPVELFAEVPTSASETSKPEHVSWLYTHLRHLCKLGAVVGWGWHGRIGEWLPSVLYWKPAKVKGPSLWTNMTRKPRLFLAGYRYDHNRGRHWDRRAA